MRTGKNAFVLGRKASWIVKGGQEALRVGEGASISAFSQFRRYLLLHLQAAREVTHNAITIACGLGFKASLEVTSFNQAIAEIGTAVFLACTMFSIRNLDLGFCNLTLFTVKIAIILSLGARPDIIRD